MGKKYIVELEDGEHLYKTTINALGNPVMRTTEKVVPYTEFDLKEAKEKAYKEGYKAGLDDERDRQPDLGQAKKEAYEKGYESGFVVGHLKAEKSGQSFYEDGYKRGLADAWNAARKIVLGDISIIDSVFGMVSRSIIIRDLAAAEVIEKLKAYKQKQDAEIKVWDEVKAFEKKPFIVTGFGYGDDEEDVYCYGFVTENGISTSAKKSSCVKTGRHFHDIDEIFKEMGGRAGLRQPEV